MPPGRLPVHGGGLRHDCVDAVCVPWLGSLSFNGWMHELCGCMLVHLDFRRAGQVVSPSEARSQEKRLRRKAAAPLCIVEILVLPAAAALWTSVLSRAE